jgi:hypothetical protein
VAVLAVAAAGDQLSLGLFAAGMIDASGHRCSLSMAINLGEPCRRRW